MRIHAEPQSLQEPLAGGTAGASVVIEPMTAGRVHQPIEAMERAPGFFWRPKARGIGSTRTWVPCPSFLVRHPTAGKLLIDTGLHASIADDPRHNFGTLLARFLPPEIEPGEDVASQLRGKGIEPREIRAVLMTHLHLDHASAIQDFPDSIFVLSSAEWEDAAVPSRPIFRGYRPAQYDFPFDYQTVDFEAEDEGAPIESYGSFARTFDLFGDGSVRLAYTPGHSAGHVSVVLRLPRRDFVVGGDVVYTFNQLEGGPPQPLPRDLHNWRRSLKELQLFHRDNAYAIITPGHEADFYEKLEDRYEE